MKNYAFLFLIMLSVLMNSSCQCNSDVDGTSINNTKNIMLSGFNPDDKSMLIQSYDISDPTDPKPLELVSFKADVDKFEYIFSFVITDNYICIQGGDEYYHRREEDDSPEYTMMLYKKDQKSIEKPVFEETYKGYPGTAYYVKGDRIFIGCNNEVRLATLKDDKITLKTLYNIDENIEGWNFHNKTIDAFVEYGDNKLLAIDDVIAPFYGFIFDIKNPGKPKYIETIDLPTYINLHYEDAVSDKDTIYALGYYGYRTGEGFLIYALKYVESKLFVKYIYQIDTENEVEKEKKRKYWDYPLLYRNLYIVGDKILLFGVDGLLELPTNPENIESSKDNLLSVEKYNDDNSDTKHLYINAYDKMKVHKFDGEITSIEVKGDYIYMMLVEKKEQQTKPEADDNSVPEKTSKLLIMKYNEKDELETVKTIDVDNRFNSIFSN